MTTHDEPNEWGFAGEGTAPEPPYGEPDLEEAEEDAAEELAVPGNDLPTELSEALADATDQDEET